MLEEFLPIASSVQPESLIVNLFFYNLGTSNTIESITKGDRIVLNMWY